MENIGNSLRGMYRDTLFNSDNRLVFDSGWASNTIVEGCRILLASFMKGDAILGISYMKVGSGSGQPNTSLDELVSPYCEQPVDVEINYMEDDGNGKLILSTSSSPSKWLEITATLDPGFPNKNGCSELREFGLFSKQKHNNKDIMINCVFHPLIQKAETDTLKRVIRLFF